MDTIALAFDHDVLTEGVLPDLENPRDIAIEYAPVTQAPLHDDGDSGTWGFVRRGRRFRASLLPKNLEMAARWYAPHFGITPKRSEQFVALLTDVIALLGDEATPDEVYIHMRDLLAGTSDVPESRLDLLTAAYHDYWEYEAQGGYIFDPEA